MADEKLIAASEASPVAPAAADGHKRKLENFELNNEPEPVTESENKPDRGLLDNGSQEGNGGADESETKRLRLENNGDNIDKVDDLVLQNGYQEEEKEHEPNEEESERHESEDTNGQPVEGQEPAKEPLETITEEAAPSDNEKTDVGCVDELGPPEAEVEEPSELPKDGDVLVHSSEREPGSEPQILSRKMDVPNDKVGVLIGKAGDTIRSLQDYSGAKIQIVRDADADPRSATRPLELVGTLESINRAEKSIKDVIAEADDGGSPSLFARGFSTVQAASGGEQLEIQVPIEKVGLIIGKGGETIRNLQTSSGARIQLIQQNLPDGEQTKERTVRVTGNKKQIETAREMIKDVMNQTIRPSPLSGRYSQQGYRPRGPVAPQWGHRGPHRAQFLGYDYPQRGPYSSQNSQYPPSYGNYPPPQAPRSSFGSNWEQRLPAPMHVPSPQGNYNYGQLPGPDYGHPAPYSQAPSQLYGLGYNETKYDHHAPSQHFGHMGSQPTPYAEGGTHSGYGPQDQYGKPPTYSMQAQVPHSQPYGQPLPSQPGEVPYQGPGSTAQSYTQNMPPQQYYPYGSSAPLQQSYAPYAGTADGYGHTPATASASTYPLQGGQPVPGYAQPGAQQPPAYHQAGPAGGYGSYPTAQPSYAEQPTASNATNGYQGSADSAYGPTQGPAAYPATAAGQSSYAQPSQPLYPQYDSSQMYGAHR